MNGFMNFIMATLAKPNYREPVFACIPLVVVCVSIFFGTTLTTKCWFFYSSFFESAFYGRMCRSLLWIRLSVFRQLCKNFVLISQSPLARSLVEKLSIHKASYSEFFWIFMTPSLRSFCTQGGMGFSVSLINRLASFRMIVPPASSTFSRRCSAFFNVLVWHGSILSEITTITP